MPAVFYHIAVGQFGAECLGKLYWLVREEQLDDPLSHRFLWFGPGVPPEWNVTVPDRDYPLWNFPQLKFQAPEIEPGGLDLNRSTLAQTLATSLADTMAGEGLGATLQGILRDDPERQNDRAETRLVHLTLCGSLAEPADSAILLGWLHALERLRDGGATIPPAQIVAGIGEGSAELKQPQEIRRAMAARALYDLQSYLSADGEPAVNGPGGKVRGKPHRMACVYLVGEKPIDDDLPCHRDEQTTLAAYTLFAITKDVALPKDAIQPELRKANDGLGVEPPPPGRPKHTNWPFSAKQVGEQVFWGGTPEHDQEYDHKNPLAVMGGYAVMTPAGRMASLLAARFCRDFFLRLSKQRSLGPPDGDYQKFFASLAGACDEPESGLRPEQEGKIIDSPEDFPSGRQREFLRQHYSRAAGATWTALGEEAQAARQAARRGWPDWGQLEQLVGKAADDAVWKRLIEIYGDERFVKVPLDDWEQAFAEFETLMENGFYTRRKNRLEQLKKALPLAVQAGFEKSCGELFARACLAEELRLEPHRLAQTLLGMSYAELRRQHDDVEKNRLQAGPSDHSAEREELKRRKEKMLATIAEIPSPTAVYCRAGLLLAAWIVFFLAIPIPALFGWTLLPRIKVCAGMVVGLVCLGLILRPVLHYKRMLLKQVRDWLNQFLIYIEARDEADRKAAIEDALATSLRHLRWLFDGVNEAGDPLPNQGGGQPIQDILSGYPRGLKATAKWFEDLEGDLLRAFQPSRIETFLPKVNRRELEPLEREYAAFLGLPPGAPDGPGAGPFHEVLAQPLIACLMDLAGELRRGRKRDDPGDPNCCLPFAFLAGSPAQDLACWRDGWAVPVELPRARTRPAPHSLVIRFYLTLAQQWLPRVRETTLVKRMTTCGDEILRIKVRVLGVAESSDVGGGRSVGDEMRMLITSEPLDPVGRMLPDEGANFLGLKRLTLILKARMKAGAGDVIFYPNDVRPTNPLGLAWRKHERSSLGAAFQPCSPVATVKSP